VNYFSGVFGVTRRQDGKTTSQELGGAVAARWCGCVSVLSSCRLVVLSFRLQSIAVDCNRIFSRARGRVRTAPRRANMACEASPWAPRRGEISVAVGCAYSRYPRCWHENQSHPGGVQQNAESTACCTPPGCNTIGQSIPWVARIRATHGYQYYTTPWCGNRYWHPITSN
jgi:hypothetical protein